MGHFLVCWIGISSQEFILLPREGKCPEMLFVFKENNITDTNKLKKVWRDKPKSPKTSNNLLLHKLVAISNFVNKHDHDY